MSKPIHRQADEPEPVPAHSCLLLDFDGPICSVFSVLSDRAAAIELANALPVSPPYTHDPFDVLRYAATNYSGPITSKLEQILTECELRAVKVAAPTAHAAQVIRTAARDSRIVAVVSNNSVAAINAYLTQHGLHPFVSGIFARTDSNIAKLKPSPTLIHEALEQLPVQPSDCVFVGDSVSDLQAAHSAGVAAIGFANEPDKADRFADHHPAAVITSMAELLVLQNAGNEGR